MTDTWRAGGEPADGQVEQEQPEQNARSLPDSGLATTTWKSFDGCVPVRMGKRGVSWEPQEVGLERQARPDSVAFHRRVRALEPDSEITGGLLLYITNPSLAGPCHSVHLFRSRKPDPLSDKSSQGRTEVCFHTDPNLHTALLESKHLKEHQEISLSVYTHKFYWLC